MELLQVVGRLHDPSHAAAAVGMENHLQQAVGRREVEAERVLVHRHELGGLTPAHQPHRVVGVEILVLHDVLEEEADILGGDPLPVRPLQVAPQRERPTTVVTHHRNPQFGVSPALHDLADKLLRRATVAFGVDTRRRVDHESNGRLRDRLAGQNVSEIAAKSTVEHDRRAIAKVCDALRGAPWCNRRRCHDAYVVTPAMDEKTTTLRLDPVAELRERAARLGRGYPIRHSDALLGAGVTACCSSIGSAPIVMRRSMPSARVTRMTVANVGFPS